MARVETGKMNAFASPNGHSIQQKAVTSLNSSHEETDSRIIQYIAYAEETEYEFVVIRSSDSDVLFILLSYAASFDLTIFLVLETRGALLMFQRWHQTWEKTTPMPCLHGLYIFTGEDANCALKGKVKSHL